MNAQTQTPKTPLIPLQPPQPILIQGVKFSFTGAGLFSIRSGIITILADELSFSKSSVFDDSFYLHATSNSCYKGQDESLIVADVTESDMELLTMWIDRCKGAEL